MLTWMLLLTSSTVRQHFSLRLKIICSSSASCNVVPNMYYNDRYDTSKKAHTSWLWGGEQRTFFFCILPSYHWEDSFGQRWLPAIPLALLVAWTNERRGKNWHSQKLQPLSCLRSLVLYESLTFLLFHFTNLASISLMKEAMEELQSQEMKSDMSLPSVDTSTDLQIDKPRTRFNFLTKNPDYPQRQWKHGVHRPRSGSRLGEETKQEMDQPQMWLCGCSNDLKIQDGSVPSSHPPQQQVETHSKRLRRRKESVSKPQSTLKSSDNETRDHEIPDDNSGITFTSKTLVANNRGKKLDLLQPIYDRMGLYTTKEKKGFRNALADLFMMR